MSTEEGDEAPPREPLTLAIHATIQLAQLNNGLRHGDYQRYRQYCTRRLRRVRKVRLFSVRR